jgi:hypothetical protein
MFRRRPLGLRRRRPINKTNFRLRQAHQLMEAGQYLRAAAIFDEMAQGALRLQIPRAPFLFIQAGRGYILGGDPAKGYKLIIQGLDLLAQSARWVDLQRISQRVIDEFDERGFDKESQAVKDWLTDLRKKYPEILKTKTALNSKEHPILPTHCPQCGGTLDPRTVNWLDDMTAECLYCGSSVRADS